MIQIKKKPSDVPDILKTTGAEKIKELKKMKVSEIIAYKYSSAIYGGKKVKSVLKILQFDKCCFCESRVSHISHGDVEHFRPKAGWVQKEKDKITKPGYYWLAFDFSNLFLSCQLCNQVYKRNYFPLVNPKNRAKRHTLPISKEKPLIIDPVKDAPSTHLKFNKEMLVGIDKKGEETIKRTGLNRKELVEKRFQYLEVLEQVAIIAASSLPQAKEARKKFKKWGKVSAEYSLMVRNNFKNLSK